MPGICKMDYYSMMFHGPGCMCGMEKISWLDLSPENSSETTDETNNEGQLPAAPTDNQ